MSKLRTLLLNVSISTLFLSPATVLATNGMNMEGYGPITAGIGGASMAYDNGTAAVINNPATLALGPDSHRADIALGFLGPDVKSAIPGQAWRSDGNAYFMPAFGWSNKQDDTTWGVAIFAQGGMGTEYKQGPGGAFSAQMMSTGNTATGAGTPGATSIATAAALEERSEVGMGRLMFPLARNINDQLSIGGTVDFVWASMDLKMAMPGSNMMSMIGSGLINGSMVKALQSSMGGGQLNDIYYGYFDFSNNSDYTGKAMATGVAGKLGLTYRLNDQLTFGAVYQSKTRLKDMDGKATVSMAVSADTGFLGGGANSGTFTDATMPLSGTIKIVNFEWPETYGAGLAYQANSKLLIAADIKQIRWAEVMEDFRMSFTADNSVSNGGFADLTLNATMPQNWDNQTVIQLGASYLIDDHWTVRGGYNGATNPIPNNTAHYLFPATVEKHFTTGVGYKIDNDKDINFSLTYAPSNRVTTDTGAATELKIDHGQTNWQVLYSHRY